jgi:striatin 1/3/4
VSVGAEGAVKVWDVAGPSGGGALALSWGYAGLDADASTDEETVPGCTAVEAIKTDIKKVAVAFQTSVIKIFDLETGRELSRIISESGTCFRL